MSLSTPTVADVNANVIAQLEAAIGQTIPLLPKSFSRVLAKALAANFILVYKYAGFMFLQWFVSKASYQATVINGQTVIPLVEWGRLLGIGDPREATRARLKVSVTVQQQIGDLPGGSLLLKDTTGVVYSVVSAVALSDPVISAEIQAVDDAEGNLGAGTIGNLELDDTLDFANPLPFVARQVTVTAVVETGAEAETEEEYRARVVARFQRRLQGGAYADYWAWGSEVAGIRNVFPYTGDPGEVDVYVETSGPDPDGIPDSAQLAAVEAAINFDPNESPSPTGRANRRSANAAVNVLPITRTAFDVNLIGFTGDATVLASIEDGIDEYLRSRQPFIVGLSALPRLDRITAGALGGLANEITEAAGATLSSVTVIRAGVSVAIYTLTRGELAKLGSVSSA